ncbi:hypothetical protein EYZ11_005199 [Aspergillus tanneri]|uniref:Uncharacterized protein n=1 Tax=Aspergillus tanneri TaxID=1220188 RepID=A0A4S3JIK0_9EURO|nr:hypothetical protein EYZ11_005199 [Aspergillus tanneri]
MNIPAGYGNVYWGEDNCLYDEGSNLKQYGCATATN